MGSAWSAKVFCFFFSKKKSFLLLVCAALSIRLLPADLTRARDLSPEIQDQQGETLNVAISRDGTYRLQTTVEDVAPNYLSMLLRLEDKRFYAHPGIDPLAMLRAFGQLVTHGKIVSGGSTITMQVARLLHPHRHDLAGKLRDMAVALQLESQLTKPQILSLYLTLAPFGGNIEGVRAASLAYFGHEPKLLSMQEAALLVALPQSPTRRRPDRHPLAAQAAVRNVLARGGEPPSGWQAGPRKTLPRLASHLAARLRLAGLRGEVRTTLQANLQRAVEALARREIGWSGAGAEMAALIVRNSDRAVLAYLGGSDFAARFGMIDMVHAVRSPGSTLKPFIYGLAFDDGLIRPDTLIEDAKLRIADYAPQDFDRRFHGTVTAAEALQQSYNLPAVTLLDWLGAARVAAALRGAGARITIPGGGPATLPLALGGVGMSLWDLTSLYAGLGAGGSVRPLHLLPNEAQAATALLTAAAAGQVTRILRQAPKPAGVSDLSSRPIAYKTGTSFGFRDAWAFGVTPSFTIGVWVGRADGTPQPGAFARGTAAPLLFRLFNLLPEETAPAEPVEAADGMPRAPALRHLPSRDARPLQGDFPHIVYPPANATLALEPGQSLSLEASGGAPPYRWAINGEALAPPAIGRSSVWQPDGPGFAHVTLTDAMEHSVQEDVRLQ
jgi:penicillin-binding protein 1C